MPHPTVLGQCYHTWWKMERRGPMPEEVVFLMEHVDSMSDVAHIRQQTQRDPVLSCVFQYIQRGWPARVQPDDLRPCFSRHAEPSSHGCVLWGSRLVVLHHARGVWWICCKRHTLASPEWRPWCAVTSGGRAWICSWRPRPRVQWCLCWVLPVQLVSPANCTRRTEQRHHCTRGCGWHIPGLDSTWTTLGPS